MSAINNHFHVVSWPKSGFLLWHVYSKKHLSQPLVNQQLVHPNGLLLYHLKTVEKLSFSGVLGGTERAY